MLRRSILLALLLAFTALFNCGSAAPANAQVELDQHARLRPEVRLRKLHLVRPDLIPYPISFEVYC